MGPSRRRITFIWIFLGIATSVATRVEAETIRFHCAYQSFSDAQSKGPQDAKGFSLEFVFDTISNKVVMIGNNGIEDVLVHKGADGMTFLELLPTGAVQSTSISSKGESVHSRHSIMSGRFLASQYYGFCK